MPLDKRKAVPIETLGQVDNEFMSLWVDGATSPPVQLAGLLTTCNFWSSEHLATGTATNLNRLRKKLEQLKLVKAVNIG